MTRGSRQRRNYKEQNYQRFIIRLQVVGVPLGSTGVTRLEAEFGHAFVAEEHRNANNILPTPQFIHSPPH
jgi:hypothetical protein